MMKTNIKLGLLDTVKNLWMIIIFAFFLSFLVGIFLASTESLIWEISSSLVKGVGKEPYIPKVQKFNSFFTSFEEKEKNSILFQGLTDTLAKDAVTIFESEVVNQKMAGQSMYSYLILGDDQLLLEKPFTSKNKVEVYSTDNSINRKRSISLNGQDYKIQYVAKNKILHLAEGLSEEEKATKQVLTFVICRNPRVEQWIGDDDYFSLNEALNHMAIRETQTKKIEHFIRVGNQRPFSTVKMKKYYEKNISDTKFILYYIYPFIFIMFLSSLLAFAFIVKGFFCKRIREYTIHKYLGSTPLGLAFRISFLSAAVFILSFLINIFLGLGEIKYGLLFSMILYFIGYLFFFLLVFSKTKSISAKNNLYL